MRIERSLRWHYLILIRFSLSKKLNGFCVTGCCGYMAFSLLDYCGAPGVSNRRVIALFIFSRGNATSFLRLSVRRFGRFVQQKCLTGPNITAPAHSSTTNNMISIKFKPQPISDSDKLSQIQRIENLHSAGCPVRDRV